VLTLHHDSTASADHRENSATGGCRAGQVSPVRSPVRQRQDPHVSASPIAV